MGLPVDWTADRLRGFGRIWSFVGSHVVPLLFAGLVIAVFVNPSLAGQSDNPAFRAVDRWWLIAGLIGANALAFRRWYPLASMAVVTVVVTWVAVTPYSLSPVAWMVYVSAFALGRYARTGNGLFGLAWFTGSVVVTWFSDQGLTGIDVAFVYAFGVMSWLAGRELSRWRDRATLERADADRRVELERQGRELAVTQQRLHIAQELHDVVAHSLGVIAVQAGMAEAAFESRPDEARRAVGNIARTSRASLTEIRRILGVLRDGSGGNPSQAGLPRLHDLPKLISAVEANGLTIDAHIDTPPGLPEGLELSAYRVIQQALTNVIEHADASIVRLSVAGEDDVLEIEVIDDGRGIQTTSETADRGYGLLGMRERVATYGGCMQAGPGPEGGFRVHATMPYSDLAETGGGS